MSTGERVRARRFSELRDAIWEKPDLPTRCVELLTGEKSRAMRAVFSCPEKYALFLRNGTIFKNIYARARARA